MKIIKVSEFRTKMKDFLNQATKEPLLITSSKGKIFIVQPFEEEKLSIAEKKEIKK